MFFSLVKKFFTICACFLLIYPSAIGQNKCENLKKGTFYSYSEDGIESIFTRSGNMQKYVTPAREDSSIWQIKWLNNCTYTLKFLQGNTFPEGQVEFIKQHTFFITIIDITDKYYVYESHIDDFTGRFISIDTLWKEHKFLSEKINWPLVVFTNKGDKVNLYENGKWEYDRVNDSLLAISVSDSSTRINDSDFSKGKSSIYLVKSKKLRVGVYIDPDHWGVTNGGINEPAEFNFTMKEFDILASLITEKTSFPLEDLAELIYQNAKNQSADVEILKKEYRIVNGVKMLCMQMKMTVKGISFIYFTYNFSNKNGTAQLTCVTNAMLFNKNRQKIEKFLNGLVIL
jgi:hypothetical protein